MEEKLTFKKAMELAQSYEATDGNAQQLREPEPAVHKVTLPQSTTKCDLQACHMCGLTNHKVDRCIFKKATCHGCGKKGNIKRAC